MRRTIAAVGLLGLGLLGTTIPAGAAPGNGQGGPDSTTICHETGSDKNPVIEHDVNENALNGGNGGENGNAGGNGGENGNAGGNGNGGENGNAGGNGGGNGAGEECYEEPPAEEPPAEEPPAEEPVAEEPAAEEPVANPVVKPVVKAPVVKPAAAKPAAAVSVPVAAPAAPNVGYNLETAVGRTDAETPVWLGAATGLFMGFSVLVLWRRREGANKAEG